MAGVSHPFPAVGEVHNYVYLFREEWLSGLGERRKERPVLVIAADPESRQVVVLPITTRGEVDGLRTVAIPTEVARAMGLPRPEESSLLTDEANIFRWVGYDLRPIAGASSSWYGRATPGFVKAARDRFLASSPQISRR